MTQAVNSPPDPRYLLALGAANMDISASSHHALQLADSNPGRIRCTPGGVARNVAENLARLGHDVHLLAAVGDDLHGTSLLQATQKAGVNVHGCWVMPGEATSTYVSLHGPGGDMAVAVNDMDIVERITAQQLAAHADKLHQAAAVLLDCNLPATALQWIFEQQLTAPIFVDTVSAFKCQRVAPWLAQVHTIKLNRLEAQTLSGLAADTDAGLQAIAHWLHAQGVQCVLLSLAERGVMWSEKTANSDAVQGWQKALSVAPVNVTGAGDALMAGVMHGFMHKQDLVSAIRFAVGCAAMTVTTEHANHPGLSVGAVQQLIQSS